MSKDLVKNDCCRCGKSVEVPKGEGNTYCQDCVDKPSYAELENKNRKLNLENNGLRNKIRVLEAENRELAFNKFSYSKENLVKENKRLKGIVEVLKQCPEVEKEVGRHTLDKLEEKVKKMVPDLCDKKVGHLIRRDRILEIVKEAGKE